jgi:diaminopimelate epimerase
VVLLSHNKNIEGGLDSLDLNSFLWVQKLSKFTESTNVEFVEVVDNKHVRCRVLERGVGETMACGSGACAVESICHRLGILESESIVEYRGGKLGVRISSDQSVFLRSKGFKVFEGVV